MNVRKIIIKILTWFFVAWCAIFAITAASYGGIVACILMLVAGVMALPIRQVQDLWVRLLGIKPVEELPEEPPAKFWQLKQKKQRKQQAKQHAAEVQKQKNLKMVKPSIIAVIFVIGFCLCASVVDVDSTSSETLSDSDYAAIIAEIDAETSAEEEPEVEEVVGPDESETDQADESAQADESEPEEETVEVVQVAVSTQTVDLDDIPAYSDSPYVVINDNTPYFEDGDLTTTSYESYSDLDSLGRCGVAVANIGVDIMPTEERGSIGSVKPTGWHTVKYDGIDGNYLYNRCHLIGYQLSGENANEKNLITGTRYLNVEGMLPFENMVADYVEETENHVLYRVTPIYDGDNLLASGVLMEAMSVEDDGDGVLFNVYCYNVQPGIGIDYATGDSWSESTSTSEATETADTTTKESDDDDTDSNTTTTTTSSKTYILNTSTKKFHYAWCSSVDQMNDSNKQEYTGSRDDLISQGYSACKRCNP